MLGYSAVRSAHSQRLFRRNTSPPSSRSNQFSCHLLPGILMGLFHKMMEATGSSETSVNFERPTRHCIQENGTANTFHVIEDASADCVDRHVIIAVLPVLPVLPVQVPGTRGTAICGSCGVRKAAVGLQSVGGAGEELEPSRTPVPVFSK
jgi:hypothetical protein